MQASSSTLVLAAANRKPSWRLQFKQGCHSIVAIVLRNGVSSSDCAAVSSLYVFHMTTTFTYRKLFFINIYYK